MPPFAKLRTDLHAVPSTVDGVTVFTLKDPITGNYFRLREPEFWLINQLDGHRSYNEISELFSSQFGFTISPDDISQFVQHLQNLYFLEDGRSEQELIRSAKKAGRQRSLASHLLYIKIKGFKPGRLLDMLTSVYRPFHRDFWFVVEFLLICLGIALVINSSAQFSINLPELFHITSILTIFFSLFLLVSVHEFAHAIVCRHYGGEVREMGFLLMYFQPCFYCDISDAWLFKEKSHRLAVTWAGLHTQLLFLTVCVVMWELTLPGYYLHELMRTCVIVSWVTLLFNINPLIKLDGYFLLSDWLEIPNLRQKAFSFLGNRIKRTILGWPIALIDVTPKERVIFPIYAILSLLYTTGLILYFLFSLAAFIAPRLGGSGILLLLLLLAIILRKNFITLGKGIGKHFGYMKNLIHKPIRLTIYLIILLAVIIGGFFIPVPQHVSGKVTTLPASEYSVSMSPDGYLELTYRQGGESPERKSNVIKAVSSDLGKFDLTLLVREGQNVVEGDTLAVVASDQVTKDLAAAIAELHGLESNLALLKASKKKEEIDEAQAKVVAAKARFDQLTSELNRTEELASRNLIAKENLESARSAAAVAKAELSDKRAALALLKSPPRPEEIAVIEHDIARQQTRVDFLKGQVDAQVVTTPIPGMITLGRKTGQVLDVINISHIEVEVPVTDLDIKLVNLNQNAQLKLHSYPGSLFSGTVVRVPRFAVETVDGLRFPVAVEVDNASGHMRQGMGGYAKIEVGSTSIFGFLFNKLTSMIWVEIWSWF